MLCGLMKDTVIKIYNCDTDDDDNDDNDDDDINISHYRISRRGGGEDHHPHLVLIEFGHYIAAYSLI